MNFTFRDLVGNGSATSSYNLSGERVAGFVVDNNGLFPLVSVRIGAVSDVVKACNVLWEHEILITPPLFPALPIDRGPLPFPFTAANTEDQVWLAIEALRKISEKLFPPEEPSALAVSSAR